MSRSVVSKKALLGVAAWLLLAGSGCGAPAMQRASSPASPASPASVTNPQADGAGATGTPMAPPEASPVTISPDHDLVDRRDRVGVSSAFERAARSVDAASSDCRQACRALASMDRACGQLCQLDADQTCTDDKTRLRAARGRVRSSCGTCPDGTSVDPDAPIPQR